MSITLRRAGPGPVPGLWRPCRSDGFQRDPGLELRAVRSCRCPGATSKTVSVCRPGAACPSPWRVATSRADTRERLLERHTQRLLGHRLPQYGSAFRFEKADGGAFSLLSLDAAAFYNHPNSRTFNVYGVTTGGPVVSKTVTLDAVSRRWRPPSPSAASSARAFVRDLQQRLRPGRQHPRNPCWRGAAPGARTPGHWRWLWQVGSCCSCAAPHRTRAEAGSGRQHDLPTIGGSP